MKMIHFIAKISDTLENNDPLYLGTKEGLQIENNVCKPLLGIPSSISQKSDPQKHTASVSNITIKILNNSSHDVSKFIYNRLNSTSKMLYGEKVEIFAVDHLGKINRIYIGIIENINNDVYETEYTLTIGGITNILKGEVFDRETSNYYANGKWETADDRNRHRMPAGFTCHYEVNREDPAENGWCIKFSGTPRQCFEGILSALMSTPEVSIGASYLNTRWQDFVDMDSLENLNEPAGLYFEFREAISNPLEFIRNQIYKVTNTYPCVTPDNKYRIKKYIQPTADILKTAKVIDANNTLTVYSKNLDTSGMGNHIRIDALKVWKNPINKPENEPDYDFKETRYFMDSQSFNKYKKAIPKQPIHFELEGINNIINRPAYITSIAAAYFSRWSLPTTTIELDVPLELFFDVSTGDYVSIHNKHLIAWSGSEQGLPGLDFINSDKNSTDNFAVKLDSGDRWDLFIPGNILGVDSRGEYIVNTTKSEITHNIFNGSKESCLRNRKYTEDWLKVNM